MCPKFDISALLCRKSPRILGIVPVFLEKRAGELSSNCRAAKGDLNYAFGPIELPMTSGSLVLSFSFGSLQLPSIPTTFELTYPLLRLVMQGEI